VHDFSNLTRDQAPGAVREAAAIVHTHGSNLRVLTDVTGSYGSKENLDELKALTKKGSPYIVKSAIVGVVGIKRILLDAVTAFVGRPIKAFDTRDAALDWLASD
jgi:hypothetical protein